MKTKNRENTLSLTENLDQMGRAEEVFERILMQPFSARCNIIQYKKTSRIPLVYALSSIVSIWPVESLARRVVLHHWNKLGLDSSCVTVNCTRAGQFWWVKLGLLLPYRVWESQNATLGPNYFSGNNVWHSAVCHVHYNGTFTSSKYWITAMGDAHGRSRPEFGD